MKAAELKEQHVKAHYIEQLKNFEYFDTDGKTLLQLTGILTRLRARQIEGSEWF